MLNRTLTIVGAVGLIVTIVPPPAMAGNGTAEGAGKVKGEVVRVEQQQRTGNAGELTRLTIRTRNGEELRLHLGQSDACQGCLRVGDRIQARVQGQPGADGGRQVQAMKVRRNGEIFRLHHDGNGNLVRQQSRFGDGPSTGNDRHRVRVRLEDGSKRGENGPRAGTGGGSGGGTAGSRGGGGGKGGGSRGR